MITIDIEASGLHPDSYPIEIAIYSDSFSYSTLVKPLEYWTHWDTNAEAIHNISRDRVVAEGQVVEEVACDLSYLLGNLVVVSDAPGYDQMWLDVLFEESTYKQKFEVVGVEHYLKSLEEHMKFHDLCNEYTKPHRALEDAKLLHRVLQESACEEGKKI